MSGAMVQRIESPEMITISAGLPEGYTASLVVVPFGLQTDEPWRQELDDREISVPKTYGSAGFTIFTKDGRQVVGVGVFAADANGVQCDHIEVVCDHTEKGIATWMYRTASSLFDAPVYPSPHRSPKSLAFWGNKKFICHTGSD